MAAVDFKAAQQRLIARQRTRFSQEQERLHSRRHLNASSTLARLPFPLGVIGWSGQNLWDSIKGREGTKPAFRVGQVDAELLDEELLQLLKGQVGDGLKYFSSHLRDDWSSEILLILRAILFKLSIWDHDASYGAVLQDLRYTDARHRGPVPCPPSKWQKAGYGMLSVGGRYLWTKWEEWLADHEGAYEGPSRHVRLLSRISNMASATHAIAALSSFLVFLVDGRYRTLLDRGLRMRLTPPSNRTGKEVSFEYLNRQLVWHAFTEFLLFLLPLVGISRWRRWISRAWRNTQKLLKNNSDDVDNTESGGELAFLPERTCAICYQDQNPTSTPESEIAVVTSASGGIVGSVQTDITNPYETSCGCVYCFVCIASRLESEEGEGWTCLRCGEHVMECRPWSGDVLEAMDEPFRQKRVIFSDEQSDGRQTQEAPLGPADGEDSSHDEFNWTGKDSNSAINGSAK